MDESTGIEQESRRESEGTKEGYEGHFFSRSSGRAVAAMIVFETFIGADAPQDAKAR